MKKVLLFLALGLTIMSCEKAAEVKEAKTAYVDTEKLVKESIEAKDIEAKYKAKYKEEGAKLEAEIARFQSDAANFEKNARTNGMAWAQQNAPELQQRKQQLGYAQNMLDQKMRQESGDAMEAMITSMKTVIKEYSKEKGYAYVFEGTSILYTDDKNDITKDVVKVINDKYKAGDKKEATATVTEEKK